MASSTTEVNDVDVPIFWLPDELLMEICSYIIRIPNKMELEQVSKRFRFVSSQSPSWKGIHTLQLIMKCCSNDHDPGEPTFFLFDLTFTGKFENAKKVAFWYRLVRFDYGIFSEIQVL